MKRLIGLLFGLLVCFLGLVSCGSHEPTTTPTAQIIPTSTEDAALAGQINLLATQTQIAALVETAVAAQATPLPDFPPPPIPETPMPAAAFLATIGPFQQVSREEALIADRVTGMQTAGDGSILLLSESGYSTFKDDHWMGFFTDFMGALAGIDRSGRVWVASRDGTRISAWDGTQWISYGADEGWTQAPNPEGNPVSTGIIEDELGNLWLATDVDVRRFDGQSWKVFSMDAMGMPPLQADELTSTFTLTAADSRGELWVGRCDWGGPGPIGGGGAVRFDGQTWQDSDLPDATACVTAILEDGSGDIWVGADSNLYRNRLGSEAWEPIALPEPPAEARFGYFATLTADPTGKLWAALALCGGASCYGDESHYYFKEGAWSAIGGPSQFGGSRFLFDGDGNSWLLAGSNISQVVANQPIPVDGLLVQSATIDPAGKLWLVAQSSGPPTLWKLTSNQ